MFKPKKADYWCYKFVDSYERTYHVDKFKGTSDELMDYLITNRNMSVDEARLFSKQIGSVYG